jgi:hypothetical protein
LCLLLIAGAAWLGGRWLAPQLRELTALALALLRVPAPLALGLLTGLAELVPVAGAVAR